MLGVWRATGGRRGGGCRWRRWGLRLLLEGVRGGAFLGGRGVFLGVGGGLLS